MRERGPPGRVSSSPALSCGYSTCSYNKNRKGRPLVLFSNFRAIKGIAKIRELNQQSFLMTVGFIAALPFSRLEIMRFNVKISIAKMRSLPTRLPNI
jgi:hypothetical protein